MDRQDRRKHRRLPLHLGVCPASQAPEEPDTVAWQTSNISSGGMYLRAPALEAPQGGSTMDFVLSVPPGVGYSCAHTKIHGSGRVVRRDLLSDDMAGVAVCFTEPLELEF